MKRLVCEVCGSNEIVKDGDYFVCQSCGTKYTIESVKKLLVEGTVTVDTSNRFANALTLARRAREENNAEDAEKYYSEILLLDPNNWEAAFYHTLYKAYQTNIAGISSAAITVNNAFYSTSSMIDSVENEAEQLAARVEIEESIIKFARSLFTSAGTFYIRHKDATGSYSELRDRTDTILNLLLGIGNYFNEITSNSNNEEINAGYKKAAATAYKAALDLDESGKGIPMISNISEEKKLSLVQIINQNDPSANYELKKEKGPGLILIPAILLMLVGFVIIISSYGFIGNIVIGLVIIIGGIAMLFLKHYANKT